LVRGEWGPRVDGLVRIGFCRAVESGIPGLAKGAVRLSSAVRTVQTLQGLRDTGNGTVPNLVNSSIGMGKRKAKSFSILAWS
jgi:hypothetical protein